MRPRNHLVVFAKAPRLGAVKRRLAADIGDIAAWRFYRHSTAGLLRRVGRDPRWRTWLWVTPDRYVRAGRFWPAQLPRTAQGGGDLGRRMARPARLLPPGPVVVVGSDIPGISAAGVARAFAALGRHEVALGPARDGGFWLVGFRRRPCPIDPFRGVRWSTEHALADTLARLGPGRSVILLETLEDIDDGAALARWRARPEISRTSAPRVPAVAA